MRIDSDSIRYLNNTSPISNGHYFPVTWHPPKERNALLCELARNKDCLHIGCADHIDLIEEKREKGIYLHDALTRSANTLAGIDTNTSAIEEMNQLRINNVYAPENAPTIADCDIVFVPDVIEHVNNVGVFLDHLKQYSARTYVFTTPNAYRLRNRVLFRRELINTDHRCWYSAYTLAKTLSEAGYTIQQIWYTDKIRFTQPVRSLLKLLFPICRDGICIQAAFAAQPQ